MRNIINKTLTDQNWVELELSGSCYAYAVQAIRQGDEFDLALSDSDGAAFWTVDSGFVGNEHGGASQKIARIAGAISNIVNHTLTDQAWIEIPLIDACYGYAIRATLPGVSFDISLSDEEGAAFWTVKAEKVGPQWNHAKIIAKAANVAYTVKK